MCAAVAQRAGDERQAAVDLIEVHVHLHERPAQIDRRRARVASVAGRRQQSDQDLRLIVVVLKIAEQGDDLLDGGKRPRRCSTTRDACRSTRHAIRAIRSARRITVVRAARSAGSSPIGSHVRSRPAVRERGPFPCALSRRPPLRGGTYSPRDVERIPVQLTITISRSR